MTPRTQPATAPETTVSGRRSIPGRNGAAPEAAA